MRCIVEGDGWRCTPNQAQTATTAQPSTVKVAETITVASDDRTKPVVTEKPQQTTRSHTATPTAPPKAAPPYCPQPTPQKSLPTAVADREKAAISIDANEMEIHGKNLFLYKGHVTMERADQSLLTDQLRYNHSAGTVDAEGNIRYQEDGLQLQGDRIHLNTQTEHATIDNARYLLEGNYARGRAGQIEMDGPYISRYQNTTYTTCQEKNPGWELEADQIEINELEGWGSAKNAVVRFKNTPILYSTQYSFPLDERRKSGFLFPSWGYNQQGGGDISVPYYWNIAPNRDATLTPRVMTKRGMMLSGNFRYLNSSNQGELDASYLADDDLKGEKRYQFELTHQGNIQSGLTQPVDYRIDYATLSDRDYLTDFGNSLELASTDTLLQSASLRYQQGALTLSAEVTDHYLLSDLAATDEPYRKLPQIDLSWVTPRSDDQINYSVEGQYVHFEHKTESDAGRYWVRPAVDYRHTMLNGAAYIQPSLSIAHTRYEMDVGERANLTIPHYTLEGGLFLERAHSQSGSAYDYIQTLDPSIQFSYIPDGRDSGETFDSPTDPGNSHIDLSEFYGKDRAPHTKQLTFALDSHWIQSRSGEKIVSTRLERTRDFRSSRTQDWTNLIGRIDTHLGFHHARVELNLDQPQSDNGWSDTLRGEYQYDNESGQLLNLGYIHQRGEKKQIDLSTAWALTPQWSLVGRYNQELIDSDKHRLEDLLGFKYESCCWSLQFARRNYFTGKDESNRNQFDTTWLLLLELKGLGDVGQRKAAEDLLMNSIKGYKTKL